MKRIFLLLSTVALAYSCAEADIENNIANKEEVGEVTLRVNLESGNPETRIAVTEDATSGDWITTWVEGDNLAAWGTNENYFAESEPIFDINKDGKSASAKFFKQYSDKLRLMYPATSDEVFGGKYTINIKSQDVSVGGNAGLSKNSYMISEDIVSLDCPQWNYDTIPAPTMKHITTAIKLGVRFSGIPAGKTVSIAKIEIGGTDEGVSLPVEADIDLKKPFSDADFITLSDKLGVITVNPSANEVKNYVDGDKDSEFSIVFNALPFEVKASDKIAFTFYLDYSDADGKERVCKTIYATNSGSEAVSFDAATYTVINKKVDMSDAGAAPVALKVGNISASALMASVNIDINKDMCDAYAFECGTGESVGGYLQYSIGGNADVIVTESGVLSLGKRSVQSPSANFLTPATNYTLAILPVNKSANGGYEIAGDMEKYTFSTEPLEISSETSPITLKEDANTTTFKSVGITVEKVENITNFFYGFASDKELDGKTVSEYANAALETNSLSTESFIYYNYYAQNEDERVVVRDAVGLSRSGVEQSTKINAFVIAVSDDGVVYPPKSIEITSLELKEDANLAPIVTATPKSTFANITINFGECAKVFVNYENADYTYGAESMKDRFYNDLSSLTYAKLLNDEDVVDGVLTYKTDVLNMSTDYVLYYMGVKEDGTIGAVKKLEFSTTGFEYDSTIKVTATLSDASAKYFEEDPYQPGNYYYSANLCLDIIMGDNVASYYYGVFYNNPDYGPTTDVTDLNAVGKKFVMNGMKQTEDKSTSVEIELYDETDIPVIIPMDKDGNYGEPVVFDTTDLWAMEAVEKPEDTTGGGPSVGPLSID